MFRIKMATLGLALSLAVAGSAYGLDTNEIITLLKNGVPDATIVNMVQSQPFPRPLNTQEVLALNANGASANLLGFLTSPGAVSSGYVAPPLAGAPVAPATEGVCCPDPQPTTVVTQQPQVVVTQPEVVVTSPPTVYYDTTYVSPTYVYPYTYPRYYGYGYPGYWPGTSYSFGFAWGGSRWYGGGDRWYGGRGGHGSPPRGGPPPGGPRGGPGGGGPRGGPPPGGPRGGPGGGGPGGHGGRR